MIKDSKKIWVLIDQTLFAGSNFIISICLARWLEPSSFGIFSTAYSILLLAGVIHNSLIVEPMSIYGSDRFEACYKQYQNRVIKLNWLFGMMSFFVLFSISSYFFATKQIEIGYGLLGIAIASPMILYLWLARRGAYTILQPNIATYGAFLYSTLYIGIVFCLEAVDQISIFTAFVSMGFTSLLAGWSITRKINLAAKNNDNNVNHREVYKLHIAYGKWSVISGSLSWIPMNIYFLVLPIFHGLEASAHLRALLNMAMPILHFNGALGSIFIPTFVRAISQRKLIQTVLKDGSILILSSIIFLILLLFFGDSLTKSIYDNKYNFDTVQFLILGTIPVVIALVNIFTAMLKSLNNPKAIAKIYLINSICLLAPIFFLAKQYQTDGALIGILIFNSLLATSFIVLIKKNYNHEH